MATLQSGGDAGLTPDLSGWLLVKSQRAGHGRRGISRLLVQRPGGLAEELLLPITRAGRINEIVRVPDDVTGLVWRLPETGRGDASQLTLRRVGRLERTLRMAYRVLRNWARLSGDERVISGLTLRQALIDLPVAYRIATQFRGHMSYADWIHRFDTLSDEDCSSIGAAIQRMKTHPRFHLLVSADGASHAAIQATLASLRGQFYPEFACSLLEPAAGMAAEPEAGFPLCMVTREDMPEWLRSFNAGLEHQAETWVMVLRAGDILPRHALYWFACGILAQPGAVIAYSDDDALDAAGRRCRPRFKPDWSPAHLRSTHFPGEAVVVRGTAAAAAGGVRIECSRHGVYDLLLRVIDEAGDAVHHIPAVLMHRPGAAMSSTVLEWQAQALRTHLARNGIAATVSHTVPGCRRVHYRLPDAPPLVSIIVPTRNALPLIQRCVEGLLQKTAYPQFEVIIVDNQSTDAGALAFLEGIARHPAVRVLRYDRPFNFSAINNFAVGAARGTALCLLNNDTEVITPDWLDEMVGHLLQPRVGVTGAKLYYPDGRVQHAGDAVGPGGCANHLHSYIGRTDPGYCLRAAAAQELSAVTAACLVTWRELYVRLGGLDEKRLPVAFNDVDYCLRVRSAGYRVVWTPHAELYHHESVSRGADDSWRRKLLARREVATMRRRWGHLMRSDPFYNPNLTYERPDFSLSCAPRVRKPWRE